ncbi:MAG: hypothetical protein KDA65_02765, partial [Planctomycetaceae bacterium]|nr:hypothetical protein [Planctomycetaceae bacterium]
MHEKRIFAPLSPLSFLFFQDGEFGPDSIAMNGFLVMTLRRLLFAFLVMATPCGVSIAQEQSTSGPQFAPLESQVPAALASKKPSFSYYSVSGAVARPGVYEYDRESVTVGELAQKAGCLTEVEAAIVRPLTQEQVETQRKLPNVQLPPIPLLQSSRFVYLPEDKVFPGELVVFRPKNPSIQQTAHQVSSINPNGKVSLILANLIGRPIHALINPDQANVFSIASYLGISPDLVEKNAVIVLRSRQTQAGANSGQMMATEPLPSGTILLFDPSLVQLEKLNTESIEQLTQSQKPIRVASKPNEESRTDVPQSDLMTEFQESESVHA